MSLILAIILSIITIVILIVVKTNQKNFNVVATFYDGFPLYYIPKYDRDVKTDKKFNECLNGGTPNIKHNTFSECNCPDNFIGPFCQYENLLRPSRDAFIL